MTSDTSIPARPCRKMNASITWCHPISKHVMKKLFTVLSAVIALTLSSTQAQEKPEFKRTEDVIYSRKFGTALTMDVFTPAKPNGIGILWMVSGGFFSSHEAINPNAYQPLLERGYTIFAIVHGSQPKYTISEIEVDI